LEKLVRKDMFQKEYFDDSTKGSLAMDNENNNNNNNIIVRLAGQGQFKINRDLLNKINDIDNSIVDLFESIDSNTDNNDTNVKQKELKEKIMQIIQLIKENGKPVENKEIIQSDLIIPNADISFDEAKKIFRGEGLIDDI
jgi:hypothetical protein